MDHIGRNIEWHPIPLQITEDEEVLRPGPDEIDYVPEPVSTTLRVPLAGRRVAVGLRYPADLVTEED